MDAETLRAAIIESVKRQNNMSKMIDMANKEKRKIFRIIEGLMDFAIEPNGKRNT